MQWLFQQYLLVYLYWMLHESELNPQKYREFWDSEEIKVLIHDSANIFAFIGRLNPLTESKIAFFDFNPFSFRNILINF